MTRASSFAWALLTTTLLRIATLFIPIFNPDEAYLATQGHVLAHGGRLYIDTADRKPPLVPLLYAAMFRLVGSDNLIAVHALAILFLAGTALVVTELARPYGATRWAALCFLLASTAMLPTDALAANFEVFMLLPSCAALLCATRGQAALAGVLLAVAILCKQTAAVTALPIVIAMWSARRTLSFGVSATVTLALACALFGPRELYQWTLAGIPGYVSTAGALRAALAHGGFVTSMMLLAHAPLVWLIWRARATPRTLVLWSWLVVSAVAVCTGCRFFGHYYLQLLPPAALLGASTLSHITQQRRVMALMAAPAIVLAIAGFFSPRIHQLPNFAPLADYVRAHTGPDERVAIWGNYPEVYFAAERSPASRIVHTDFLTGVSGGRDDDYAQPESAFSQQAWREYFADLERNQPRIFIDASANGFRHYEHQPIARYPALAKWIDERYELVATIEGMRVYAATTFCRR